MLSTPVLEAASISMTSMWRDFEDGIALLCQLGHVDRGAGRIVEGTGDQACRGRLANAAHTCEHVGLRNTTTRDGIGKRTDHRLLTDEVGECLGAVFTGKDAVPRGACAGRLICHGMLGDQDRGGRLDGQPVPISLGLLPSGPDPVGERYVRRQPPARYMVVLLQIGKSGWLFQPFQAIDACGRLAYLRRHECA